MKKRIFAALLAALLAVFSAFGGNLADPLSNVLGIVTAPARNVATRFFDWTEGIYNYAFQYEELEAENARLKQELAQMERKAIEGEASSKENALLREALKLQEKRSDFVLDMATVTSRSVSNWDSTITINKGSIHDLAIGDCVIDEFGALVGIIEEVGTTWASARTIIDPDYSEFFSGGDMVRKVQDYCRKVGQPVPETVGQIARAIYESLALKYRWALERLEEIKGQKIDRLNIVGGGIQNRLLNQMAADSVDREVITGPIEGAAMGNLLAQAMALGDIKDLEELRQVVRNSETVEVWTPNHTQAWEDAYQKLLTLLK